MLWSCHRVRSFALTSGAAPVTVRPDRAPATRRDAAGACPLWTTISFAGRRGGGGRRIHAGCRDRTAGAVPPGRPLAAATGALGQSRGFDRWLFGAVVAAGHG